jgi:aspartate/methionine/tyrosine aminotransferase
MSTRSFEELLARPGLAWMGQNTTHLEPPAEVLEAMGRSIAAREFQLYAPPSGFARLRDLIVDDLGLAGFHAWVTDGAVGGLRHICTALAPELSMLVTSDPGWPWPSRFIELAGVPVTALPIYEQPGVRLSAAQIAEVVKPGALIYLIDPLNPIGSRYSREELAAIAEIARENHAYMVHDATYRHFADGHTLVADLYPERTFTTYSFSKWLGLAGLRLGAVVAEPDLLARVMRVPSNPLGSSIVAERAAIAGLEHNGPWLERLRTTNRRNLEEVERVVAETGFGRVVVSPSQANFLAIDVSGTGLHSEAVCAAILEHDVFIRPGTYQSPAFGERFVKVSTSVPEAWADRFVAAWGELAGQAGSS